MKKQIKRFVLSVLVLTMVFSCIPAATYAKEQFKWSKSLVLKGKMYHTPKDARYSLAGDYVVTFFSDRHAEATVQNYNGCVYNYSRQSELASRQYNGEGKYSSDFYYLGATITADKEQKKNAKASFPIERGWNAVMISPCTNVTLKDGQEFKCEITVKDANILFGTSERKDKVDVGRAPMFSKKKFTAFKKWWMPQYKSLQKWEGWGEDTCNYIAEDMKIAGITDKKVKALSKEIQQYVENKVQKSKTKGGKIISYKEVVQEYVDSIDGFEEKLCAVGDLSDCDDYFVSYNDGADCWNWLQHKIKNLK